MFPDAAFCATGVPPVALELACPCFTCHHGRVALHDSCFPAPRAVGERAPLPEQCRGGMFVDEGFAGDELDLLGIGGDGASDEALKDSGIVRGHGGATPGGHGGAAPGGHGGATPGAGKDSQSPSKGKGGKGKGRAGWKKCRGCDKLFEEAAFPLNSAFCAADKRALDVIARRADKQGEEAKSYYKECREDPSKVKEMLQLYWNAVGGRDNDNNKKKKAGQFCVLRCMETMRAVNKVLHTKRSQAMWKEMYLRWAQTDEGGRLDSTTAQRRWEEYEKDPNIARETVDKTLWLYVPTVKFLDNQNGVERSKEMQLCEKEVKKDVNSDLIDRTARRRNLGPAAAVDVSRSPGSDLAVT